MQNEPPCLDSPKHLFVILNPVAGLADSRRTRARIQEWCDQHGWTCEMYETREGEDLARPIKKAREKKCSVVAAAGGDGTISSVAAGMVFSDIPLLILPVGTGNLLARDLSIPMDLTQALNILEEQPVTLMLDSMQVNGRYCVLNAGVGFSSILIKNTPREDKRRLGFLAYFKGAAIALLGLQPYRFRLSVDGKTFKIRASEIYIANGGLLGVQYSFEDVKIIPDDGRIDLFAIKARTLLDYLEIFYYILRRQPRQAPKMFYLQAAETVVVSCEQDMPVQSDGEVVGHTPVTIQVIPNAVKVLLPSRPAEPLMTKLLHMVGR